MKTVSVIIPVYNAEKYLTSCVRSVLRQSYRALQVLLVNDGSTDGSLALCQAFAQNDSRIQVLNKTNGGVSSARNAGLAAAIGTYVQFLDSDDTIHRDMVKVLVGLLEGEDADIAFCSGETLFYRGNHVFCHQPMTHCQLGPRCCYTHTTFLQKLPWLLRERGSMESPCNRLYRRELITKQHLQFSTHTNYGEDFLFNIACYGACRKVVFTDRSFYYYHRRNEDSLSSQCPANLYQNQMYLIDQLEQMLDVQGVLTPTLREETAEYRCRYLYHILERIAIVEQTLTEVERLKRLQTLLNDNAFCAAYLAVDCDYIYARQLAPYVRERDAAKLLETFAAIYRQIQVDAKRPITSWLVRCLRNYAQRHPNTYMGRQAQLLQLNLATVGLKTTLGRVGQKLLRIHKTSCYL